MEIMKRGVNGVKTVTRREKVRMLMEQMVEKWGVMEELKRQD